MTARGAHTMDNLRKFYIDGAWVEPDSRDTMPVINPATEAEGTARAQQHCGFGLGPVASLG